MFFQNLKEFFFATASILLKAKPEKKITICLKKVNLFLYLLYFDQSSKSKDVGENEK